MCVTAANPGILRTPRAFFGMKPWYGSDLLKVFLVSACIERVWHTYGVGKTRDRYRHKIYRHAESRLNRIRVVHIRPGERERICWDSVEEFQQLWSALHALNGVIIRFRLQHSTGSASPTRSLTVSKFWRTGLLNQYRPGYGAFT
jgi:hypothetical protein